MNGEILMTISRRLLIAILLSAAIFIALAPAQARDPYVPSAAGVHAVSAERGMVVAQEKIAARIGGDILGQGGNAVDAAVATGFAMAVTYPRAGNIGGGGFMVIHLAARGEDIAIDYREMAPAATTRDIFLGPDGKPDDAKSRDSLMANAATLPAIAHRTAIANAPRSDAGWVRREINCTAGWSSAGRSWRWHRRSLAIRRSTDERRAQTRVASKRVRGLHERRSGGERERLFS